MYIWLSFVHQTKQNSNPLPLGEERKKQLLWVFYDQLFSLVLGVSVTIDCYL